MNPNLAQELLAASLENRLAVASRRRLAAAAAPPAALRQRWGSRLVSLGAFVARDPDLADFRPPASAKGGGSWSSF
jgi:hypothetical protein